MALTSDGKLYGWGWNKVGHYLCASTYIFVPGLLSC